MHGVMIDVTEAKLATEALARLNAELETRIAERTAQLVQAQKLDMVGQITGALAHDFNNLLFAFSPTSRCCGAATRAMPKARS